MTFNGDWKVSGSCYVGNDVFEEANNLDAPRGSIAPSRPVDLSNGQALWAMIDADFLGQPYCEIETREMRGLVARPWPIKRGGSI